MTFLAFLILGLVAMVAHIRVSNLAEKVRQHELMHSGRLDSAVKRLTKRTDDLNNRIAVVGRDSHSHIKSVAKRLKNVNIKSAYLLDALSSLADKLGYKVTQEEQPEEEIMNKEILAEAMKDMPPFFKKILQDIPLEAVTVHRTKNEVPVLVVTKKVAPRARRRR